MEDTTLVKIAVFCSLVGILILYAITTQIEPAQVPISKINESYVGKFVRISGRVTRVREFKKSELIEIENNGRIYIYALKSIIPDEIKKGQLLMVSGQVQEYKGNIEIVPKKEGDLK